MFFTVMNYKSSVISSKIETFDFARAYLLAYLTAIKPDGYRRYRASDNICTVKPHKVENGEFPNSLFRKIIISVYSSVDTFILLTEYYHLFL